MLHIMSVCRLNRIKCFLIIKVKLYSIQTQYWCNNNRSEWWTICFWYPPTTTQYTHNTHNTQYIDIVIDIHIVVGLIGYWSAQGTDLCILCYLKLVRYVDGWRISCNNPTSGPMTVTMTRITIQHAAIQHITIQHITIQDITKNTYQYNKYPYNKYQYNKYQYNTTIKRVTRLPVTIQRVAIQRVAIQRVAIQRVAIQRVAIQRVTIQHI